MAATSFNNVAFEDDDQQQINISTSTEAKVGENQKGEKKFYDFEVLLKEIGDFGKYQIVLVLMAYWITIPTGITAVASVFLAATPDYRCDLSPLGIDFNLTETQLQTYLLPTSSVRNSYDRCSRYEYNLSACVAPSQSCIQPQPTPNDFSIIKCDQGVHFDKSVYPRTIITEFNLVCDRSLIAAALVSVYFCGILLSSLIGGNIADRFGRTPVMLVTEIVLIGIGIACSYSPNLAAYGAFRFIIALFLQAGFIGCFVYVMEITGEKWRTLTGVFTQLAFASGYMLLSGFAYIWRDWRQLQFAISFVPVPFLLFWFLMPESPRWLFEQGKNEKAVAVCEKMAKKNGRSLSKETWREAEDSGKKMRANSTPESLSPVELFKRTKMRLVTINMMFNWFVNSLVYYGLSLNAGALAGTDFLNNFLSGLVEVGAYLIVAFTMDKLGRRFLLTACLLLGGVACLASTVFNHYSAERQAFINTATALALIGKMAISGSFAIIYNFTAELYPTSVRSTAVGVCSMAARIGSIITPFTLELQNSIPWLTGVIFGVLALSAGFLSLFFPETSGRQMPTSLDDAEIFYRGETSSSELTDREESYKL